MPRARPGAEDRLRVAAFAEFQAHRAFLWAAERFADAPEDLRRAWRGLALEERLHRDLILSRMRELGLEPAAKPVSAGLWRALTACKTREEFSVFMRQSEERGREAELRFCELFEKTDPATAAVFRKIADDEARHIAQGA